MKTLINSAKVVGYENIYDFKNKKPHSADLYRLVFETNVWSLFNITRLVVDLMAKYNPTFSKQTVIIPDRSDMKPSAPPDSDPDGTSRPVENSVVVPTDPMELRARILARFPFPKENSVAGMLVLRLDYECLGIFTFIRAIKKACMQNKCINIHSLFAIMCI